MRSLLEDGGLILLVLLSLGTLINAVRDTKKLRDEIKQIVELGVPSLDDISKKRAAFWWIVHVWLLVLLTLAVTLSRYWSTDTMVKGLNATKAKLIQTETNLTTATQRLEAKTDARSITRSQVTNFIVMTESIAKMPIKIVVGQEGPDTRQFASQLRELFDRAGFPAPTNAGPLGINWEPSKVPLRGIEPPPDAGAMVAGKRRNPRWPNWEEWPDVAFVYHGTGPVYARDPINYEFAKGVNRPVVATTNIKQVHEALASVLSAIRVSTGWVSTTNWVAPGEYEILVPAIRH